MSVTATEDNTYANIDEHDIDGVLADINTALRRAAEKAEVDYRHLAAQVANGANVERSHIQSVIFSASKTCDDFSRHVKRICKRRKALADREHSKKLEATLQDLAAKRDSLNADLVAMTERHRSEIAPLKAAVGDVNDEHTACRLKVGELERDAVNELNATLPKEFRIGTVKLSNEGFVDPLNIDWT